MNYNEILDFKLLIRKFERSNMKKFRLKNYFLFNLNYDKNIQLLQESYYWEDIPYNKKKELENLGYNKYIWKKFSWPIRECINELSYLCEQKIKHYYFNTYINKIMYKRSRYEKMITWLKLRKLTDLKRCSIIATQDIGICNYLVLLPHELMTYIFSNF